MGEDKQWVLDMNLNCSSILKPDMCIFFDVDPDSCHERIEKGRVYTEIFERDLSEVQRIRQRYYDAFDYLKDSDNIKIIDAVRTPEEIFESVKLAVDELYK